MEVNNNKNLQKLVGMGFHVSNKGFDYMVELVNKIQFFNFDTSISIMKLYDYVATKYNTKTTRVERCLRHLIDSYYTNSTDIPEFLTGDASTGKLTNQEFLYRMARYLAEN